VEALSRAVFAAYNYGEIRTPIFEETQLFARGVGEETDIVSKEMYTFADRDGASLTLRPEATASVVRAYIEHRLWERPGLTKVYYLGPMFRRERPQKGRYRQFYQIGAEAIGSESPAVDAEMIEMLVELLNRAGLKDTELLLNSIGDAACRPAYLEKLRSQLAAVAGQMCADCQRRAVTNPLRVLDCKVPQDQPIIERLPKITEELCGPCRQHFVALGRALDDRGIPYTVVPRMVRGLDYYTRTTFEFVHGGLGAQNAVLGGGRYDGLSEALGGPKAPGIGFSIGEDRFILSLLASGVEAPSQALDVYVIWLPVSATPAASQPGAAQPAAGFAADPAFRHAAELARDLRARGLVVELAPEPRKVGRALEMASKLAARYALIIGENEIQQGLYQLKDLTTREARQLSRQQLADLLAPQPAPTALL
jgi:histidyl-tRNA synthetase